MKKKLKKLVTLKNKSLTLFRTLKALINAIGVAVALVLGLSFHVFSKLTALFLKLSWRVLKLAALIVPIAGILLSFALVSSSENLHLKLINEYRKSNVFKISNKPQGNSGGTAFLVKTPSGKSYIMTNAHVCSDEEKYDPILNSLEFMPDSFSRKTRKPMFLIQEQDDGKVVWFQTEIFEIYEHEDLCLLYAPVELSGGIDVAESAPSSGSKTFVLGRMLNIDYYFRDGSVIAYVPEQYTRPNIPLKKCEQLGVDYSILYKRGYLIDFFLGTRQLIEVITCMQTREQMYLSNQAYYGSSGSPVLDYKGDLVGVIKEIRPGRPLSVAVSLKAIVDFLKDK
jgi:hypothetical protein